MGPKIEAACDFIRRGGHKVIITSLEKAGAGHRRPGRDSNYGIRAANREEDTEPSETTEI